MMRSENSVWWEDKDNLKLEIDISKITMNTIATHTTDGRPESRGTLVRPRLMHNPWFRENIDHTMLIRKAQRRYNHHEGWE